MSCQDRSSLDEGRGHISQTVSKMRYDNQMINSTYLCVPSIYDCSFNNMTYSKGLHLPTGHLLILRFIQMTDTCRYIYSCVTMDQNKSTYIYKHLHIHTHTHTHTHTHNIDQLQYNTVCAYICNPTLYTLSSDNCQTLRSSQC